VGHLSSYHQSRVSETNTARPDETRGTARWQARHVR
jgi:hypothetical protein